MIKNQLPGYLMDGAIIVDVRSPAEFSMGHAEGSLNFPLQELESHMHKLDKSKKILLCCASGSRSGVAAAILKARGFADVINAGPWGNLKKS